MERVGFEAWSTRMEVLFTRRDSLDQVRRISEEFVRDVDGVASRFRSDSELSMINRVARHEDVEITVSPLLRVCLQAALRVADLTDGLVTPTVHQALLAAGYDRDIDDIRGRETLPRASSAVVRDHHQISLRGSVLRMPRGFGLDLGATAKAWAAEVLGGELEFQIGGGFLVNLGGDIAVTGHAPYDGWQIDVEDADGSVRQTVTTRHQGFATSSTGLRTWRTATGTAHHIIDPRTGDVAVTPWRQVTTAGVDAVEANAASTAAVVLGVDAPDWLTERGVPALLVGHDGTEVRTYGWPAPARSAA